MFSGICNTIHEFLRRDFDKLLLTSVFLLLVGLVVHMSHDNQDASIINWAREQAGTVLGALLGLITGVALRNRDAAVNKSTKEGE